MGVALLWKYLEDAEQHETLLNLNVKAFEDNASRGLRLGVDCSLWLFHARTMRKLPEEQIGADADIRMLFFRVAKMYRLGVLPFFVFDGPDRPAFKRGARVMRGGGMWAQKERRMQAILDAFGFPWRYAQGEAEAELAACAKRGEIDAVLTDDVDTLIFGAPWIIRNASENLSSNKSAGKKRADAQASQVSRDEEGDEDNDDDSGLLFDIKETPFCEHTHRHFHSEYIEAHYGFCTDELVLVALLAGGDYDVAGCANIGIVSAMALIESGFGRSLVDGYWRLRDDRIQLRAFLDDWRGEVAHELRTNSRGKMKTKKKKAADELDADSQFPSIVILEYYLEPVISELPPPEWSGFVDISRLARLVQRNFEWGNEEVKQKLRNNIYQGLALEELRKAALVADTSGRMTPITAEEDSIFYKISDERCNKSTMYCPCYRVELAHVKLDKIVSAALPEEDPFPIPAHTEDQAPGRRTKPIGPATTTDYRHWMPVAMVDQHPHARRLAELWKEKADEVRARKLAAEERKRQREESRSSSVSLGSSPRKASPVKMSPLKSSPLKSSPLKLSPLKASPWKSRHQSEPSSPSSTGRLDSFVRSSKPCLVGTNTNVIKPVLNGPSTTLSSSRASTINRDAADDWLERRPPPTLDLKAIFGSPIAAAGPSKGKKRSSTPPTRRASSDSDDDIIVLSPISHGGDLRKKRNVLANDPSAASGSLGKGKSKEVECIVLD